MLRMPPELEGIQRVGSVLFPDPFPPDTLNGGVIRRQIRILGHLRTPLKIEGGRLVFAVIVYLLSRSEANA